MEPITLVVRKGEIMPAEIVIITGLAVIDLFWWLRK